MEPLAILTAEQTARVLQMNVRKIYRLLETGELPGRKIGGSWRVSGRVLFQWADAPWPKERPGAEGSEAHRTSR